MRVTDTYTFYAPTDAYIMVSIGETGTHDVDYIPEILLFKPSGSLYTDSGDYYNTWIHANTTTNSGTWTVDVTRATAI